MVSARFAQFGCGRRPETKAQGVGGVGSCPQENAEVGCTSSKLG